MAEFKVNPTRLDPCKNFKFRVKLGNNYVAGLSAVTGLTKEAASSHFEQPGQPVHPHGLDISSKTPLRTKSDTIALERGETSDAGFGQWTNHTQQHASVQAADVPPQDLVIESYDEAGRLAASYTVKGCRVTDCQATPAANGDANAIAIQHITLKHEGWERTVPVTK
jgi:phage tail-like protein